MIEPRAGWVVVWIGAGLLVAARVDGAARAVPVSPGAPTGAASSTVAGGCPTFSWSPAGSTAASELAVLEIGEEGDLESAQVALRRQVPAGATSWTPGESDCLAPERDYAWLVRAVDIDERAGREWSSPLYFRVASAPSAEEVAAALALLERWRASQGSDAHGSGTGGRAAAGPAGARGPAKAAGGSPRAPLVSGASAIHGEMPDTSGAAFGVFGVSHSAQGAGLVGRNETAGADLVLDGAAQGEADTLFTQAGIDRPSGSPQNFDVQNSGAGAMTLRVGGVAVDTATTAIDWTRLASVPAGFADGIDDDSGGDITGVSAGSGLSGGGSSGAVALAASFGGSGAAATVSRSDHDHLGQSWIGSTGLVVQVSTEGNPGLWGLATATSGQGIGVFGSSLSTAGIGIYGHAPAPGTGRVLLGQRDRHRHPLEGRRLVQDRPPARPGEQVPLPLLRRVAGHDERLQRQRRRPTSDGDATVELPEWFEALNRDFRYQLTVIGGGTWARARVARRRSTDNRFVIRTDVPATSRSPGR